MPRWTWYLWTVHQKVIYKTATPSYRFKLTHRLIMRHFQNLLTVLLFLIGIFAVIAEMASLGISSASWFPWVLCWSRCIIPLTQLVRYAHTDCQSNSISCIHRRKITKMSKTITITTSVARTAHVIGRTQTQMMRYSFYFSLPVSELSHIQITRIKSAFFGLSSVTKHLFNYSPGQRWDDSVCHMWGLVSYKGKHKSWQ